MITSFDASLAKLSIHRTGNRMLEEYYALSDEPLNLEDEILSSLLMQYFLKPFEKLNEVYHFQHSSGNLDLNEVFHFASEIFRDSELFHENSQLLAKYLYDVANHPKIKSGEMYVTLFNQIQIEGEQAQAIGIFKSETKDTFLKVFPKDGGFGLSYEQEGININKLDKGCLIVNLAKEDGYKVLVVDHTNRQTDAAVYWKDEFLKLKIRNDSYNQTQQVLGVYKNFVTEELDKSFEISKADKIDLLNKSMKYFKDKESFDMEEFGNEVIGNDEGIASFMSYAKNFEEEFESPIPSSFEISEAAVKKQSRVYKSVLKLDKNFHIYIHGNKELIEKGFDDEKHMNYYKVYFKEEI
ncbi:nucleoid-associated protein [Pedobacter sp. SYP-B3415]|uniref:nucleoid-associated protein n=1 Tax=Pedobacter sp. SYP-B3415 TaxID=2496641 RepID=UPI00101D1591|nr:nucleoid-associated protein [Pedobacter sp. SYP-B3415]